MQEDQEFKSRTGSVAQAVEYLPCSLSYIVSPCLKTKQNKTKIKTNKQKNQGLRI
jgi:hypothetical protein